MAAFNASLLVRRLLGAALAGQMFGGKRKLYEVYGYPLEITPDALYAKYERQDITSRIVDNPAEEVWTNPPIIETASTAFQKAWSDLVDKFKLWAVLTQIDRLCNFGEFSALWVGLPGDINRQANPVSRLEDVVYIQAYGGNNAEIDTTEVNPRNPRFGKPLTYSFKVSDSTLAARVHWSRVVHIVDKPLVGDVLGVPRLSHLYNLLEDLLKIAGGSAETYWLTANRGIQADVDKEMTMQPADEQALSEEVEEYQHQLRRVLRTRGVKITSLGSDVADPRGVFEVIIGLISATTGIPQRILLGAEAGQLASEQDRANWAEYIQRRRKAFAEPYVLLPVIDRFAEMGLLPKLEKRPTFKWPEAFHQNPLERAQTMAQSARATVNMSRQTQYGFPLLTLEEARTILGLPPQVPSGQSLPPAFVAPTASPGRDDDDGEDGARSRTRARLGVDNGRSGRVED